MLDLEAVWCHWCHVMDEITYPDPKVIELIGSQYIAVRVDQDSRPDISNRYEDYGWPATIVFNADGGEIVKRSGYIPPKPMASMLQAIIDDPTPGPSVKRRGSIGIRPWERPWRRAAARSWRRSSTTNTTSKAGGWGMIHKFVDWDAIEYCHDPRRAGGPDAERNAKQARQTLTDGLKLIDPVWGGVYQYSTDGDWDHPHFEKLMAFQSELMRTYSQAYARCGRTRHTSRRPRIFGRFMDDFLRDARRRVFMSARMRTSSPASTAPEYFALTDAERRQQGIPRVDQHLYARENGWAIYGLVAIYAATGDETALADAREAAAWAIAHRALPGGRL